jgi:hypothetical protein
MTGIMINIIFNFVKLILFFCLFIHSYLLIIMPRFISPICKDLIDLIPPDADEKFISLKNLIDKHIIQSIPFAEPEMVKSTLFWNKLSFYLNDTITYHDYNNIPWCKQLIDIFQDPNYKINDPNYHFE